LYRFVEIRGSFSLAYLIPQVRSFYSSAKHLGVGKVVVLGLIILGYLAILFHAFATYAKLSPTFWILASLSMIGSFTQVFLLTPQRRREACNFFILEEWKLLTSFKRKTKSPLCLDEEIMPKKEKFEPISSYYPLLKYTNGFFGEKNFDLNIRKDAKPHVIFICLESFRAKNVGFTHEDVGATPQFDQLCREGIYFQNFHSNAVLTDKALFPIYFGILPRDEKSVVAQNSEKGLICLSHHFHQNGYQSAFFQAGDLSFQNHGQFLRPHFNTIVGKEIITEKFPKSTSSSWGMHDEFLFEYGFDWLQEQTKPSFLTLFTITSHHPWLIPSTYHPPEFESARTTHEEQYLQAIHYTDFCLEKFVRRLKEKGLSKNCILFIFGDHGHPVGRETGVMQKTLYDENIKIPLLIWGDDLFSSPQVISETGSQVDLYPTVLDMMDWQGVNHSIGTSLMRKASRSAYFQIKDFSLLGCSEGEKKFIYNTSSKKVQLFDRSKDPKERIDLSEAYPTVVQGFKKRLDYVFHTFDELYSSHRLSPDPKKDKKLSFEAEKHLLYMNRGKMDVS